jgi:hypothetical protein
MTRRLRSLRLGAAMAGVIALAGCVAGTAHRVPGTDMALPASSYADQFLLMLARPCERVRPPAPSATPTPDSRQSCPVSADTALGQPGTVARGPVRVP